MRSIFAVMAVGAVAVGFAGPAMAQDPDGILVYSAQHASLTREWAEAFTAETGIPVTIRQGTDMQMANQIVQEGVNSPADLFLTENSPAMMMVDQAGLFAPVDPETLAQIPEAYRPASGNWTGIAARTTVFVYNTNLLAEEDLPVSMVDLMDPSWAGRWGAAPAGADFQAIVGALLLIEGEDLTADWLHALREGAERYRGNSEAMRAVNIGEIDGAVIYHYYWFGDQARTGENSNNTRLHYFGAQDAGAFVSISGGGVIASSGNLDQAQAFLKWITGPTGQTILRDGTSYEYAIGSGIAANPMLPPLDTLDAPVVDPSNMDARSVVELMAAAGLL
ncbi:MAG: iron ABC transporter substrate-binding protein [Bauldia sp.]|nr:iron ABC transporter substrate-binding protein [Bauldia sp.]